MDGLPAFLLSLTLLGYVSGAMLALAIGRRERLASRLGFGAATVAGALGLVTALLLLVRSGAPPPSLRLLPSAIPPLEFSVRLDPLGAFFLLVVSLLGLAVSLYSLGYAPGFFGRKKVGGLAALYNLMLLATSLVFLADNVFFFLFIWELMALTAWGLVSFNHEDAESRRAGVLFLVMSHVGTGCLTLGFLLLSGAAGSYSFQGFREAAASLPASTRNVVFLLFLAGFGVKAGLVPLHIWLPAAHPVAPTNVSALMSGVLIKTGIYGLTRVLFDFLGLPPLWWGVTVLGLGLGSAVLGVLYALMEHNLKRLLAYHSIENIGIILMGLGAALMFRHAHRPLLATLALVAGLLHTLNHALFKGLLFLGAGAVLRGTGAHNLEDLGGLIKPMPKTALFFLIGAVAISALPPLNGFVSEWLTYQAFLQGFRATDSLARLMFPVGGALLALTGALAAACFVKAFGITFLGQPRSARAAQAREAAPTMLAGMALLTAACVFLGLFATVFLPVLDPVTQQLTGAALSPQLAAANGLVLGGLDPQAGTVSPLMMVLLAGGLLLIPLALWLTVGRQGRVSVGPTWDCGLQGLTPRMQYSATGFSKPLRLIFRGLFRPQRRVRTDYEFSRYFAKTLHFESHIEETFEKRLYRPLHRALRLAAHRLRVLQAGSLRAYLIYIFLTLVLLLLFAL